MRGIGHLGGLVLLAIGGTHANVPSTMRQVREKLACGPPQFACVSVETVKTPSPKEGEALIRVNASSVNPSDVDNVEGGGCMLGCGADVAGTVVACPKCTTLSAGDEVLLLLKIASKFFFLVSHHITVASHHCLQVWTAASHAYSDYVIAGENRVAAKPKSLSLLEAGTIPEVGLTSLFSLKRTAIPVNQPIVPGSPWTNKGYTNLTVVITAGAGGTGFIGIELARAFGAVNIFTAASGADEIAFVKSLGATLVVDYKVQNLFSALPDDSVDIVYDNYGEEGTADKAMHAIRSASLSFCSCTRVVLCYPLP